MKLGMMLEIDETFTTIWLSRSSEVRVKVRRWPQSHIGTIFLISNHENNEKNAGDHNFLNSNFFGAPYYTALHKLLWWHW